MSRGKKARQSQNRRDWGALEHRASEAERKVEKLAAELDATRRDSAEKIQNLHHDIAAITKQRDAGVAPALTKALDREQQLRDELAAQKEEQEDLSKKYRRLFERLHTLIRALGLTGLEAMEVAVAVVGDFPNADNRIIADGPELKLKDPDRVVVLQRSRGERRDSDFKSKLIAALDKGNANESQGDPHE